MKTAKFLRIFFKIKMSSRKNCWEFFNLLLKLNKVKFKKCASKEFFTIEIFLFLIKSCGRKKIRYISKPVSSSFSEAFVLRWLILLTIFH